MESIQRNVLCMLTPLPFFIAHELMHCMNLHHSFDNDSKHIFKIGQTDNIMDYSHQTVYGNLDRNNLFYWQMKILNPKLK